MQSRGGGYRMLQSQRPRMMAAATQSYRAPFNQQQPVYNNYQQQDNYGYQHYVPRPSTSMQQQPYQYEVNLEHYPTPYEEEFSTDAFGSYPPPPSSLSNFSNNNQGNYSYAGYPEQPYYQQQQQPPMMQFRHVNVPPVRHSAPSTFQKQVPTAQYRAPVAPKTQRNSAPPRRPLNPTMEMLPPPKPTQSAAVKRKVPMKPAESKTVPVDKKKAPVVVVKKKPQEPAPPPPFVLYDVRILSGSMQQLFRWKDRKHKSPPIYETAGILMSDEVVVNGYRHEMEHRFSLKNLPEWRRDAIKEDQELDCVYYADDRSFSIFSEFAAGTTLRIVGRFFGDGRLFQVFKFREATDTDLLWMTDRLKSFEAANNADESSGSMTQKKQLSNDFYDDPCAMYFF